MVDSPLQSKADQKTNMSPRKGLEGTLESLRKGLGQNRLIGVLRHGPGGFSHLPNRREKEEVVDLEWTPRSGAMTSSARGPEVLPQVRLHQCSICFLKKMDQGVRYVKKNESSSGTPYSL